MFRILFFSFLFLLFPLLGFTQVAEPQTLEHPDDIFWDNRFIRYEPDPGGAGYGAAVYEVEYINEDTLFIAGNFQDFNGILSPSVSFWNGSNWNSIPEDNIQENRLNNEIYDVEYANGMLFMAGRIWALRDLRDDKIASYDFHTGTLTNYVIDNGYDYLQHGCKDIELTDDGGFYVSCELVNSSATITDNDDYHILKWDGFDFTAEIIVSDGPIHHLKQTQQGLVIAGDFSTLTTYNSITTNSETSSINNIALLTPSGSFNSMGNPILDGSVDDIDEYPGGFAIAGEFYMFDGNESSGIAYYDFASSSWTNYNLGIAGAIDRIEAVDENLFYFAGDFQMDNGSLLLNGPRYSIGRYSKNPISGFSLTEPLPTTGHQGSYGRTVANLQDLKYTPDGLIAVGDINSYRSQTDTLLHDMLLYSDGSWKRLHADKTYLGLDGPSTAIESIDGAFYVGGGFDYAGELYTPSLAVFEQDEWHSIGYTNGSVYAIDHDDRYIYIGGEFSEITYNDKMIRSNNIGVFDREKEQWVVLESQLTEPINLLKVNGGTIIARTQTSDDELIFYWNDEWNDYYPVSNEIRFSATEAEQVIISGEWTYVFGDVAFGTWNESYSSGKIAYINDSGYGLVKLPDHLAEEELEGLSQIGEDIFLITSKADDQTGSDQFERHPIYKVSGDTVLPYTEIAFAEGNPTYLTGNDQNLIAYYGYDDLMSGLRSLSNLAVLRQGRWEPLGSGIKGSVYHSRIALNAQTGEIAFGGDFRRAGATSSTYFAIWHGTGTPSVPTPENLFGNTVIEYSDSLTFSWSNPGYATGFEFQLSDEPSFSSLIIGVEGLSDHSITIQSELATGVDYFWRVRSKNKYNYGEWSQVASFQMASTVSNESLESVDIFSLDQNYPNPFNPSTTIRFTLANSAPVNLSVYDVTGRKVVQLLDGEMRSGGAHQVLFNASELASGLYFYRIEAGSFIQMKKMMLIK